MENCESDKTLFWRDLEEQSWKNMRCRFSTVILTKKFSEVLLSLTSLLPLSWERPSTLSGKSHVTHPWNRYPDQMTFRRQTWSAFDSTNNTSSLDSGLRHGNDPTEAVRQICNYIPVKTSSWILKSCWRNRSDGSFWWKATGYILWD